MPTPVNAWLVAQTGELFLDEREAKNEEFIAWLDNNITKHCPEPETIAKLIKDNWQTLRYYVE